MRQIYRQRRKLVLDTLRRDFGGRLTAIPSTYGMHITALLGDHDANDVAARMHDAGFRMHTLDRYYLGETRRQGLVIGCGIADQEQLASALNALDRLIT
jgi:GntR family transcriptional regulator/MocR family aminotransferase